MDTEHPPTAALLIIGNEVLSGKVRERNLSVLACDLRNAGIALRRVVVIPDEIDVIVAEVQSLSNTHDMVFTSGGIGPTHDDVTIAAVAKAFGVTVRSDPQMEMLIQKHFGDRVTKGHLLMARVPDGCELVCFDPIQWPTVRMHNVWILPGVPEIFRMRLASMKTALCKRQPFISRSVYSNMDEGDLVPLLDQVVRDFPDISIGSYPKWHDPACRTELTFDGLDSARVEAALHAFVALLPQGEPLRVSSPEPTK